MPVLPVRTNDLSTRLAVLREFRNEYRSPFNGGGYIDDSGYCIDAPAFIPAGSLKRDDDLISNWTCDYQPLVIR